MEKFYAAVIKMILSCLAIFAPIQSTIITALTFSILDWISGVWAAKKRGESFSSSGLKRTLTKASVYLAVICLSFLVEKFMTGSTIPLVNIAAGYIGLTELKSIMENMEDITGVDILKALIEKISNQQKP